VTTYATPPSAVAAAITQAAEALGINPRTALADAYVESGWNAQAVGDQGTSFGLFQLHRGGELGTLSEQQAFDPLTNAMRALTEFKAVQAAHPGDTPGQLAAAAQRPANAAAYAARVDAIYNDPNFDPAQPASGAPVGAPSSGPGVSTTSALTSIPGVGTITSAVTAPLIGWIDTWAVRGALFLLGLVCVLVALASITKDSASAKPAPSSSASPGRKAPARAQARTEAPEAPAATEAPELAEAA
jgi:hypothetical protein